MSEVPVAVQQVQNAEEKIVRSVEISAAVVEELVKFGGADFDTVTKLSDEFLQNLKEAQETLLEVVKAHPERGAFQGRAYIERLQADAAEAAVTAAKAQLAEAQEASL